MDINVYSKQRHIAIVYNFQMIILGIIMLLSAHLRAITFVVSNSSPICLEVDGGAEYYVEYIVSGPNQNLLNFTVYQKQQILLTVTQKAEYNGKHLLPLGEVQFCFTTIDSYSKSVSVYFAQQHSNQIQTKKQKTKNAFIEINKAVEEVKTVYRNQHYQMERDNQHKAILEGVETKVKWGGIIKIIILIAAGFLQFWILRRYIQNPPKSYTPIRGI